VSNINPAASKGAISGAGAGALIGAIIAGTLSGGLGAPAGAAIGGMIGATLGGAGGALSAKDAILCEIPLNSSKRFPLDGLVKYTLREEKHTANAIFKLSEAREAIKQGNLELGKNYLVYLKEIKLSKVALDKGGKDRNKHKYYIEFHQGEARYPFSKDDPFTIPADIALPTNIFIKLKNNGEDTKMHVYKKNRFLKDDLIYSSKIGKIDGKSWAFIGKATADDVKDNSFILFETYGPLQ
jgi:hypothetical protein